MSNDDDLLHEIPRIAERAGEPMWPLPIPEEMADKVRASKIADLCQHNTEACRRRALRRGLPARVRR